MNKEVRHCPGVSYRPENNRKHPWRVCVERKGYDRFQKTYATQAEAVRAVSRFLKVNHLAPMRRSDNYAGPKSKILCERAPRQTFRHKNFEAVDCGSEGVLLRIQETTLQHMAVMLPQKTAEQLAAWLGGTFNPEINK